MGIDVRIGTRDPITQLLGQYSHATHEGAADTEDVNVHTASRSSRESEHSSKMTPIWQRQAQIVRQARAPKVKMAILAAKCALSGPLPGMHEWESGPQPVKLAAMARIYGHLTGHRYNIGLQT